MKNTLTLIATLLPLCAVAQSPTPALEGIGKLKITKTTLSIIPELENELKTKVKQVRTYSEVVRFSNPYLNKNSSILELMPDTVSYNGPVQASQCTSAKVYLVPKYQVSGIEIRNLKLVFWESRLIEIECDGSPELDEALKLKYGEGKAERTTKDVPCRFTYTGNEVVYKEEAFSNNWDSTEIKAQLVLKKYYDEKCKEQYLHYVSIAERTGADKHLKCQQASVKRRQESQQADKKKRLSDF